MQVRGSSMSIHDLSTFPPTKLVRPGELFQSSGNTEINMYKSKCCKSGEITALYTLVRVLNFVWFATFRLHLLSQWEMFCSKRAIQRRRVLITCKSSPKPAAQIPKQRESETSRLHCKETVNTSRY